MGCTHPLFIAYATISPAQEGPVEIWALAGGACIFRLPLPFVTGFGLANGASALTQFPSQDSMSRRQL
jgi:hypothetical protein